jgi:SAM-dependent methyltransferase
MSRVDSEKKFHNLRFSQGYIKPSKYYKALEIWNKIYLDYIKKFSHLKILEIGSGLESICHRFREVEKLKITSIDISDEAIALMKDLDIKGCSFYVMDAHKTTFTNNSFDLICGKGILHHLDIKLAVLEIKRLLKSNGSIIFAEPLNSNFIINLYRYFTPNIRTEEERPLSNADIYYIQSSFNSIKVEYFGFITLFFSVFNFNSPKLIHKIDYFILNFTFIGKYIAWSCLIYTAHDKHN